MSVFKNLSIMRSRRYVSVGDVALVGDYSESQTVTTYRNDEGKFETPSGFDLVT